MGLEYSEFLETTKILLEAKDVETVFNYVGKKIFQLSNAKIVILTERDTKKNCLNIKTIFGMEGNLDRVLKLTGFDPTKTSYPIESMPDYLLKNEGFIISKGGLFDLAKGQIPEIVSQAIEKLLGITSIYSLGFLWEGEFYGETTFFFTEGKEPTNKESIEIMVTQASVALRRIFLENNFINSELRYRRLFEAAQDGILLIDFVSGSIIDINPFLVNLLGFPKEELLGKALWEVGIFKDRLTSKENFIELQTKGYIRYEDLPLKTKEGGEIEVEFVSNVYDVAGAKMIQCNIRNITERKKSEELLSRSEEKFKLAFETSPDSFSISTLAEGMFVSVNKGFESMTGYMQAEVIGKTVYDIGYWKNFDDRNKMVEELNTNGLVKNFEASFVKKNGETFYGMLSASKMNIDGVTHILNITRDVSDRKRSEEDISKKIIELERFNKIMVDRELKMVELKEEVSNLKKQLQIQ